MMRSLEKLDFFKLSKNFSYNFHKCKYVEVMTMM